MAQNKYVSYKFNTLDDFVIYLGELIKSTYTNLRWHKIYLTEMEKKIDDLKLLQDKNIEISERIYIDARNRIGFLNDDLLNLIGDDSDKALSYKKFRRNIDKNENLGITIPKLPEEIIEILNQMNVNRNWGLHIPESLVIAQMEMFEKAKSKSKATSWRFNPIAITEFVHYNGQWLVDLFNENTLLHTGFFKVFQQMKKDYSCLIGTSMEIEIKQHECRPLEDMDIPKISYEMQTNKYKGLEDKKIWIGDNEYI